MLSLGRPHQLHRMMLKDKLHDTHVVIIARACAIVKVEWWIRYDAIHTILDHNFDSINWANFVRSVSPVLEI